MVSAFGSSPPESLPPPPFPELVSSSVFLTVTVDVSVPA